MPEESLRSYDRWILCFGAIKIIATLGESVVRLSACPSSIGRSSLLLALGKVSTPENSVYPLAHLRLVFREDLKRQLA